FSLMQTWQSSNDLDRHLKSPRFGVLLGSKSLLEEPLQVKIHTVFRTKGMEAIHTARNRWS
ncbi:MAG: antibiotic biosynthesis monooxygenase, partial [Thermodesulfobacteriota bacterium]